jgi:hypothetical protein
MDTNQRNSAIGAILSNPINWIAALIILGIIYHIDHYSKMRRAMVFNVTDVSDSVRPYATFLNTNCNSINDRLIERDTFNYVKFADRPMIISNTDFEEKQVGSDCQTVTQKPPGIGKNNGTDFEAAVKTVDTEIYHRRIQGNTLPAIVLFSIQAAEPVGQKVVNFQSVKKSIENIAKTGYVSIIGPDVILQSQLNEELKDIPNVKVCSFQDAKACGIDWAFNQVRK